MIQILTSHDYHVNYSRNECIHFYFHSNQIASVYRVFEYPSLLDKDCIKYIDYDLDLKLMPDKNIIQLDTKEYEYHRKKYVYSNDLDIVVKHANEKCKKLMKKGIFPFDDNKMREYYEKYSHLKELQEKNIISAKKEY